MKKPDRPKTNAIGWMFAFLFPKKNKPIPAKPVTASASTPFPEAPPRSPATPPVVSSSSPTSHPAGTISAPPPAAVPPPVAPKSTVSTPAQTEKKPGLFSFQPRKLLPAFWTVASVLSFIVNMILIVTLIILGQELFELKRLVGNNVLGGLYDNFVLMDQANIKSNIKVEDRIPVNFNLDISQDTVVVLTEPTFISNVMISLNSGGLSINSPANITLPAGTNLPVHLQLTVPVNTEIPITLNVPVDIPLDQTELHEPFVGLQNVIGPYNRLLDPSITTPSHVPLCQNPMVSWFCNSFFVR